MHPVILVAIHQETPVDGTQVDDGKSVHLVHLGRYCSTRISEQTGSMYRLGLKSWGSLLSAARSMCLASGSCLTPYSHRP